MARPKKEPREGEPVDFGPDAGPALYKDRAGKKLGGGPTEGASYSGHLAEHIRASVPVPADDPPPAA
jgi:hypothetical protein